MYDNLFADMNTRMKPVMDLVETNKKVLETLAGVQKDTMTDVVNASLEQFQALSKCQDPKAAMDLQVKFFKALEAKMTDTTEKSIAAFTEAKEAFSAVIEDSAKQTAAEVEAAVEKVSGKKAA
ncbi:MAG: phasin family protein [Halopseudomonas sp.]